MKEKKTTKRRYDAVRKEKFDETYIKNEEQKSRDYKIFQSELTLSNEKREKATCQIKSREKKEK